MKIISKQPIQIKKIKNNAGKFSNACGCSGVDGSLEKKSVKDFQIWANGFHDAKLAEDGISGPLTTAAYLKWGAEWSALQPKITPVPTTIKPAVAPVPTPEQKKETPKVKLADKWKALSTTKKGLVIGGGVIVTGGIIFLIYKLL